jgi:hypothetical protein
MMKFDFVAEVDRVRLGEIWLSFDCLIDQETATDLDINNEVVLYDVLGNTAITRVDDIDGANGSFLVNVEAVAYEVVP